MKTSALALATTVLALATPLSAATIVLHNAGGVAAGSAVANGFAAAAGFWASVLTDNVTINIDVGYAALATGVLGQTGTNLVAVNTANVESLLRLDATSALDAKAVANLPKLSAAGGLSVITSGYANTVAKTGVNTAIKVYDTDNSANNTSLAITTANAKALGYTGFSGADASITFSSKFSFDFNPVDGIAANSYDFIGIATHEIGHALGFISGVDTYDSFGAKGPGAGSSLNLNDYAIGSVLDLFRYAKDPTNLVAGTAPVLDWSVGGTPYFSVDGGKTALTLGTGSAAFSTGAYNGNGRQASHWVDNKYTSVAGSCQLPSVSRGLMDPTAGKCEALSVSAIDLAAFDAIGWNLGPSAIDQPTVRFTTAQISGYKPATFGSFVPEPASWALLITGFGLTGAALRRRRLLAA